MPVAVMGESAEDVKREEEIVKVSNISTFLKNFKKTRRIRGPLCFCMD